MKKFLLLALAVAAPAARANTDCSDATGEVQYHHQDYNRGIPPRNGDVLGTTQIRVRGKLVSESVEYKGLNPKLGPIGDSFTDETVLHQDTGSSGFVKDYSALMTLTRNAGNFQEVPGITLPYSAYVICRYNFLAVP